MNGKNTAFIYGGGQIPCANIVLGKMSEELLKRRDLGVYGVNKSFMGLADSSCYEKFSIEKAIEIQSQIGTYLSTCRKVDPASDEYFSKIISNLKERDIQIVIIPGGDGSSRAGMELSKRAKAEGYKLQIIFLPCTIDGINGSDTIGIGSAVAESKRQAKLIMANAFATWNPNFLGSRVAIIEMQGRNRNDLAVRSMREIIEEATIGSYSVNDINLIFIPAAYEWSFDKLLRQIESTGKETAVIISEGARPTERYWDAILGSSVGERLANVIKSSKIREANLNVVGYLSQTNNNISDNEINKIQEWVSFAVDAIGSTDESIAVIRKNGKFGIVPLSEFAQKTDSKNAIPLTEEELYEFARYLP